MATITPILSSDFISSSRETINDNFSNLNSDILSLSGNTALPNTNFNMGTGSLTATNGYFTGVLKLQQAQESFSVYTSNISSATVNLDCSASNVWYITSAVTQNWTVNLQNTGIESQHASNIVLLINQSTTGYIPSAVQIGGAGQTINWQGGSQPSANANKKDSISFTILNNSGTYIVLGQLVTFG
jgi:hypothetical protein